MNKDFLPYEQALALKELGFDEPCFGCYFHNNKDAVEYNPDGIPLNHNNRKSRISAPLYSQAFRWFREKYNISYSIDWMSRSSEFYNGYYVHFRGINDNKINQENFIVLNDELPLTHKGYGVYKTYEEAEQACLNKLIEIVKNNNK
jgi:hypothetical protein